MTPPFEVAQDLLPGTAAQTAAIEAEIDTLLTTLVIEGVSSVDTAALNTLAEHAGAAGLQSLASAVRSLSASRAGLRIDSDAGAQLAEAISGLKQHFRVDQPHPRKEAVPPSSPSEPARSAVAFGADAELLHDFIVEAREHLTAIEGQLLAIENDPNNFEVMHAIFRAFHTIKGMAGFMELERVQTVAHEVETLLDLARNGKLAISSAVVDVVLESADYLRRQVDGIEAALAGRPNDAGAEPEALLRAIRKAALGEGQGTDARGRTPEIEIIPIPEAAQSSLESPTSPSRRAVELDGPLQVQRGRRREEPDRRSEARIDAKSETSEKPQDASSVRVETGKLDHLLNMIGEMVIAQSLVRHNPTLAANKDAQLTGNMLLLARITSEVQHATMALRMIPIGTLFQRSARLVRDLARKAGKDVVLQLAGEDTELDKKIAEELSDPLMHMIRNALDHGIETRS